MMFTRLPFEETDWPMIDRLFRQNSVLLINRRNLKFFFFSAFWSTDRYIYNFQKGTIVLIKKRIEINRTAIQFRFGNRNTRTSPAQTIPNVTILCEVADIEPFQGQSDQIFQFLVEKHPIFFSFFFFTRQTYQRRNGFIKTIQFQRWRIYIEKNLS